MNADRQTGGIGGMQDRCDAGQWEFRIGGMQDRRDAQHAER